MVPVGLKMPNLYKVGSIPFMLNVFFGPNGNLSKCTYYYQTYVKYGDNSVMFKWSGKFDIEKTWKFLNFMKISYIKSSMSKISFPERVP